MQFKPLTAPHPDGDAAEPYELTAPLLADCIELPTTDMVALQGKVFDFPVNPDDGYVDGSIYFAGAHNPVDITRIEFGQIIDGQVLLTINSSWVLSFEATGFDDFDFTFSVPVAF